MPKCDCVLLWLFGGLWINCSSIEEKICETYSDWWHSRPSPPGKLLWAKRRRLLAWWWGFFLRPAISRKILPCTNILKGIMVEEILNGEQIPHEATEWAYSHVESVLSPKKQSWCKQRMLRTNHWRVSTWPCYVDTYCVEIQLLSWPNVSKYFSFLMWDSCTHFIWDGQRQTICLWLSK